MCSILLRKAGRFDAKLLQVDFKEEEVEEKEKVRGGGGEGKQSGRTLTKTGKESNFRLKRTEQVA